MFKLFNEITLRGVDGISCIKINPWKQEVLALSTWNGFVDCYDIFINERINRINLDCPMLAVEWISVNDIASAGADGIVYINGTQIGFHNAPISSLAFSISTQILASGSYDGIVKFWNTKTKKFITEFVTDDKIYCMAPSPPSEIVCGCGENRMIHIDCQTNVSTNEKTLMHGYNTRSIAACESMTAVSVVQGRIAVINRNNSSKTYAFKAHLNEPKNDTYESTKTVYPVNTIAFQPNTDFLASGGTDGAIYIWDVKIKRKVQSLCDVNDKLFQTSVSSLSFSSDGMYLAAAISYCFEHGPIEHAPDRLVIYRKDDIVRNSK
ncbi:mitotic checkpoint protein [Tritrichomonas foetus]|uniref:Mitotic checkpoint protein n=1 Tax=Tritrichomonas foetus TaxID=1144522 RepID=A0A1J4JS97_9EUKA|nr:mitotic checkpoint protein [Tritrichomonas foetus]|eukprot:OHT02015.1 mitotic checkpoint protein [Tritrichomonas foetus]